MSASMSPFIPVRNNVYITKSMRFEVKLAKYLIYFDTDTYCFTLHVPWSRKRQPTPAHFAWKISWTEEPGGLQSKGLQRGGHE